LNKKKTASNVTDNETYVPEPGFEEYETAFNLGNDDVLTPIPPSNAEKFEFYDFNLGKDKNSRNKPQKSGNGSTKIVP